MTAKIRRQARLEGGAWVWVDHDARVGDIERVSRRSNVWERIMTILPVGAVVTQPLPQQEELDLRFE